MALTQSKDSKGQSFRVDWEEVSNIVGAHSYLRSFVAHARESSQSTMLGSVKGVTFDHKAVRETKRRFINASMPLVVQAIQADHHRGQQYLVTLRLQTAAFRKRRDEMFAVAEASGKNFDWWADKAVGAAQLVRDTGFSTVAVLAAPVGGAWAIGATAFSAAGSFVGKYEDTGNLGSAAISGAGSLLMAGWGKVVDNAAMQGAAKGVLVCMGCIFDSGVEMLGSVAEGKNGDEIARNGLIKLITGGLGAGIDAGSKKRIDAVWDELKELTKIVGWKDAALRTSLEAAKKGTEKVAGYVNDQVVANAAATQVQTSYIRRSVVVSN